MKTKNLKSFDVLGSIAIVNFPLEFKSKDKKKFAEKLLKENKSIKTILEKSGKIKGRLRKPTTKFITGEKTKEVLYKENNCVFRFNIDTTYFSPRLSNERKEISSEIKKDEEVLVMFAGVAPYSIVIAKNSKAKKVYSNEINREANKYAQLNIELNKVKDRVELVSGDIKRVAGKLNRKFEVIVMPRPKLKETFLEQAFKLSKKNTRIYYYDFCEIGEENLITDKVKKEAIRAKKKIKVLKVKKAGEVAPYKIRIRIDFKII
jgi:tRNA (guanine37-N1)-methyltransferase